MKDYLEVENLRNKTHASLYERLVKLAFGECEVMVGHHIALEFGGDLNTENEIPSADTLLFCPEVMVGVFGVEGINIMQELAALPPGGRESLLQNYLDRRKEKPK